MNDIAAHGMLKDKLMKRKALVHSHPVKNRSHFRSITAEQEVCRGPVGCVHMLAIGLAVSFRIGERSTVPACNQQGCQKVIPYRF